MRRVLVILALAGCSTTVVMEDPCACVVIPTMNGALSMAMGRQAQSFDGPTEGTAADTVPISGFLFSPELQVYSVHGVKVSSDYGLGFEAVWNDPVDMRRPAGMTSFSFDEEGLFAVGYDDARYLELGPQGGQVTLTEIVPGAEGGWRVRGSYRVQACDSEGAGCESLSGSFAFDAESLPAAATASGLVAAGS